MGLTASPPPYILKKNLDALAFNSTAPGVWFWPIVNWGSKMSSSHGDSWMLIFFIFCSQKECRSCCMLLQNGYIASVVLFPAVRVSRWFWLWPQWPFGGSEVRLGGWGDVGTQLGFGKQGASFLNDGAPGSSISCLKLTREKFFGGKWSAKQSKSWLCQFWNCQATQRQCWKYEEMINLM